MPLFIEELLLLTGGYLAGANHLEKVTQKSEEAYKKASLRMAKATARMYEADAALKKEIERLVTRKQAVISVSLRRFVDMATVIKKICFDEEVLLRKAEEYVQLKDDIDVNMTGFNSTRVELTDKQILAGFVFGSWIGGMLDVPGLGVYMTFRQDAKLEAAYAEAIRKEAKVHTEYANVTAESIELLCRHFSDLTEAITMLNALFLRAMIYCEALIEKNGGDKQKYSFEERKALMLLFDMADVLRIMVCTPVLDKNNQITESILGVLGVSRQAYDKFSEELMLLRK